MRGDDSIWCPELLENVFKFLDVKSLMKVRSLDHTCKEIAERVFMEEYNKYTTKMGELRRWRKIHLIDSSFIPNIRWHSSHATTDTEKQLIITVNDLTSLLRGQIKQWTPDEINRVLSHFIWENFHAYSTMNITWIPSVKHFLEKLESFNLNHLSKEFRIVHQTATFLCGWLVFHEEMEPIMIRWIHLYNVKESCGIS